MTRDLQIRMQELRYTTAVKERFEGELSAARNIQMSLVPKRFPAFPERTEFDVHALLRSARLESPECEMCPNAWENPHRQPF